MDATVFMKHSIWSALSIGLLLGMYTLPLNGPIDAQPKPGSHLISSDTTKPLQLGVIGLVHGHAHWILRRGKDPDIELVGIVEPNLELAKRLCEQYGYAFDLVYESIDEFLAVQNPEAVTAFNTIYDHLQVVQKCAPKGIHVMVEKPMAVSWAHAQQMAILAKKHGIKLLTNYETTWYGSHWEAYDLINIQDSIGPIRKINFYTGHPGPREIGCSEEFLAWLTDPVLNGAGALTDFGCYGANLATWLMKGAKPTSVSCVTQQIKPHLYPNVDDDATIVLTYPEAQVLIQASWNWSHNRKETEVYGKSGFVFCRDNQNMVILTDEKNGQYLQTAEDLKPGFHDPFAYLQEVVRNHYQGKAFNPNSLENNLIVMQILEAAKVAAAKGETIIWSEMYPNKN